ncbi:uncharacterized protein VTP21DRAFT_1010 [Calcarisporiella thermophila]|uniref:uncharacterized protein n=1 Tax=Calcarisporiella thermophila TaxID=911321 RepID=UPI003742DF90
MRIIRLQLGTYADPTGTKHVFCLYLLPTSITHSSTNSLFASPACYRLRDVDVLFFEAAPGKTLQSEKIPRVYVDQPGHLFVDRCGERYLSAYALAETAVKMGNYLLAEFCQFSRADFYSGTADRLLQTIQGLSRLPLIETEEEFSPVIPPEHTPLPTPPFSATNTSANKIPRRNSKDCSDEARSFAESSIRRMAIEDMLDTNNSCVSALHSPSAQHNGCSVEKAEEQVTVKQEPLPDKQSPDNQNPKDPSVSHSLNLGLLLDNNNKEEEGNQLLKRRKISPLSIVASTSPERMKQLQNTLRLKQQQKAIIESRQLFQQSKEQPSPLSAVNFRRASDLSGFNVEDVGGDGSNGLLSKRARIATKSHKNLRNLTIFAPSYSESHVGLRSAPPLRMGQQGTGTPRSVSSRKGSIMGRGPTSAIRASNPSGSRAQPSQPLQQPHQLWRAPHTSAAFSFSIQDPRTAIPCISEVDGQTFAPYLDCALSSEKASPPSGDHDIHNSAIYNRRPHTSGIAPTSQCKDLSPQMPYGTGREKQKKGFLSHFEALYDNIESTRALKSTLEDQIRHSATLLQTLQQSSGMVESLVRSKLKELLAQEFGGEGLKPIVQGESKLQEQMMSLATRLSTLENKFANISTTQLPPSPSEPSGEHTLGLEAQKNRDSFETFATKLESLYDRLGVLEKRLEQN